MFIPFKLFKLAVRLSKIDADDMTEKDVDAFTHLIVEVFGNRFTVEELYEGSTYQETMALIFTIMAKIQGGPNPGGPNPTLPG